MKKLKAFTLAEMLVTITIIALLASVTIVGSGVFVENRKVASDCLLAEQMNDLLQYTSKGEKIVNVTQVYRIIKNVYTNPESDNVTFVWDKALNKILVIDKDGDHEVKNLEGVITDSKNWYYIDGTSSMIINDSKVFDYNEGFKDLLK